MNNFVLANETFYSALIIAIFIFSDATPELYIKFAAGVVLISSTFLLLFANFLMVLIMLLRMVLTIVLIMVLISDLIMVL